MAVPCIAIALAGPFARAAAPVGLHQEPIAEAYYADAYADHYKVPRELVHAVIDVESNWHPHEVSNKGAMGLMQLMPATARAYGVRDPFSISDNINGGVQYLADLIKEFGDLRLVAAAYYTGPSRVGKRGLELNSPEVTVYVQQIRRYYDDEVLWHQNDGQQ
jgi:soluble lytic murein transglycosylase-like protein